MLKMKKIVVFGGVFDPVHNGHVSVAQAALRECGAEQVVFLPERIPYRKPHCTPYDHRANMLRLAVQNTPEMLVLDYPRDRQTIVKTFEWLSERYPGYRFSWLIGHDVIELITTWPGAEKLEELNVDEIVVAFRAHATYQHIPAGVVGVKIRQIHASSPDLRSTEVRADIRLQQNDVPPAVYDYIVKDGLYPATLISKEK